MIGRPLTVSEVEIHVTVDAGHERRRIVGDGGGDAVHPFDEVARHQPGAVADQVAAVTSGHQRTCGKLWRAARRKKVGQQLVVTRASAA